MIPFRNGSLVHRPGNMWTGNVDRAYAHDGTGVLALEAWKNMSGSRLAKATEL